MCNDVASGSEDDDHPTHLLVIDSYAPPSGLANTVNRAAKVSPSGLLERADSSFAVLAVGFCLMEKGVRALK